MQDNNDYEIKSKIGAYGNVIVDDKTLKNTELSYLEENKSMVSYNKSALKLEKQTSNISKISRNPITKGAYSSMKDVNFINKLNVKNPEYYYEDEIILEEIESEKQTENLIVNEVKNKFLEKVNKINHDFLTVSNNAKKNNDYFKEKYNIPKNINDEFLNSSNIIKIMSNTKSGKMPPKLFGGLNSSNTINNSCNRSLLQESNLMDEFENKEKVGVTEQNEDFENYFNIIPDNSMMNITALTNNIIVKENSQVLIKSNPNSISNVNKIPFYFSESGKFDELNMISCANINLHNNYNFDFNNKENIEPIYAIKKNNNFDIIHDSIINEFENTILQGGIINNDYYINNNQIDIPKADYMEKSFLSKETPLEKSNNNKEPELNILEEDFINKEPEIELLQAKKLSQSNLNESKIQPIEKIEEPKKLEESFFEETFFEEKKENYNIFKSIENGLNENAELTSQDPILFKYDKHSLTELFGKNLIQNWNEVSKQKLNKIKKGIKEDKYFLNSFFEEELSIDFNNKASRRNFIKGLDSYKNYINHIFEDCSGKDFFEINDLFKVQEIPICEFKIVDGKNVLVEPKYDWGNNAKFLEEKKIMLEKLSKRQTKTTFNKISFLYNCEVLKQKYSVCSENIDYNCNKASIFGDENELEKVLINHPHKKNLLDENDINNFNEKNLNPDNDQDSNSIKKSIENKNEDKIYLWRESLCDGNSFYRMFIFAYFENLITTKNIDLLAKIFFHIYKVYQNLYLINESKRLDNEKFIFNKINLKVVLISFNFIINFMRKDDYASAYKIMLNAFNFEDGSFDKIVIGYLRLNLLDYINYIERSDADSSKKNAENSIIKKKLFRNFTYSYIEPEEIILELTAKMYNVNIDLICVDGSIDKNVNKKFEIRKKTYSANETNKNENIQRINLFYNLNCYFKYYSIKDYSNNLYILKRYSSKIKEILFDDSQFECNLCNKKVNNKKIYFKNQIISACVECIRIKADLILNSRFFNLQKDGFLSREYYCKPLNIEKQIVIDDSLYMQLFGKNIWNEIINRLKHNCSKCNEISESLLESKTNINYCRKCLSELINKFTNNLIVLNEFEKRQMLKKNPELPINFDLEESLDFMQLKTEEKLFSADQRLKNTYETLCCNCIENKKNSINQSNENSFFKFLKVEIYDKNSRQISTEENKYVHLICKICIEKHKEEFEKKKIKENCSLIKNNKIDSNNKTNYIRNTGINRNTNDKINNLIDFEFMCEICNKKHFTIIKLDENNRNYKKACCSGCSIF